MTIRSFGGTSAKRAASSVVLAARVPPDRWKRPPRVETPAHADERHPKILISQQSREHLMYKDLAAECGCVSRSLRGATMRRLVLAMLVAAALFLSSASAA